MAARVGGSSTMNVVRGWVIHTFSVCSGCSLFFLPLKMPGAPSFRPLSGEGVGDLSPQSLTTDH